MKYDEIVNEMTIEEKAKFFVGKNFYQTYASEKFQIESLFLSDGPNGLRKQDITQGDHLGINESKKAVCYPAGVNLASTWDVDMAKRMGQCLGMEAASEGVNVVLGPAMNIKRTPLCGRNFEYYSEDPYLTGKISAAYIKGMQSNHVSACVKHFVANNQETRRKAVDAIIDERTLREIYLAGYEIALKEGSPWSLMTSYNKVNGQYVAENHHILKEIVRDEWKYDGVVLSDWGAMNDIVASVKESFNLQMPGDGGYSVEKIVKAVEEGALLEEILNENLRRLLSLAEKADLNAARQKVDLEMLHDEAGRIAESSMVLLKNENVLPLKKECHVAVIGEMAKKPRYQGSGSSHVNCFKLDNPYEEICRYSKQVVYAQGYIEDKITDTLLEEAVQKASNAEVAVVFVGLPDDMESEASDRSSIDMPQDYILLVEKVAQANPNTVVVLMNGAAINIPFHKNVPAILEMYLGGEAGGRAAAKILFGEVNPSGKLAETFVAQIEQTPAFLNYPGDYDKIFYREGIFVGYRYYEKKKIKPVFAFGHGLSYTKFWYSDLKIETNCQNVNDVICNICFDVENTGSCDGQEVIQLYVKEHQTVVVRPEKELKAFTKVFIPKGEKKHIQMSLDARAFAYYDTDMHDWHINPGMFEILIGSASDDIRLSGSVEIGGMRHIPEITRNTMITDINKIDSLRVIFEGIHEDILPRLPFKMPDNSSEDSGVLAAIIGNMTLNSLQSYVGDAFDDAKMNHLIAQLNEAR